MAVARKIPVRKIRKMVMKTVRSTSAPERRVSAIKTLQTTQLLSRKNRKRLRKTGVRMAGAEESLARRLEAASARLDRVVQRGMRQNVALQQASQQRREANAKRTRDIYERANASAQKLGDQVRAKRLRVDASQASTALRNNASNLRQNMIRANANLKIEGFDLQRNAAKFRRKQQLLKADFTRKARNLNRKRKFEETEYRENVQNFQANVRNRQQKQQIQQFLNRSGAQSWRANVQTAQKRARLAAELYPYKQQATAWAGVSPRPSEQYAATIQPLLTARPASTYLAPRRNTAPISRSWQIT